MVQHVMNQRKLDVSGAAGQDFDMEALSKIRVKEQINSVHETTGGAPIKWGAQSNYKPGGGGIDLMKQMMTGEFKQKLK